MSGSLVLQIAIGIAAGVALSLISPVCREIVDAAGQPVCLGIEGGCTRPGPGSGCIGDRESSCQSYRPAATYRADVPRRNICGCVACGYREYTLFPTTLALQVSEVSISAPQGITEVLGGPAAKTGRQSTSMQC